MRLDVMKGRHEPPLFSGARLIRAGGAAIGLIIARHMNAAIESDARCPRR